MAPVVYDYSTVDRLVHRLAFASPAVQLAAADIEKLAFANTFAKISANRPIFITSLPRAGTTIMLTALHRLPMLATHLYRDMPFVMAPILWSRLSGRFRKQAQLRERAHGDGMQIGYDSPEAFEEVIWRAFWPGKYAEDGIALWTAEDTHAEAAEFLRDHTRKIIALRCSDQLAEGRYISKNNANIARIDLIPRLFPDARILVPVRKPLDHAASLLRQHLNFLDVHARDSFARRYMADIGHFEFGALHRPIRFPGLAALIEGRNPTSLDYWLAYWIAAFEYVLSRRDSLIAVSYEGTCGRGTVAMGEICERLGIDPGDRLEEISAVFRTPTSHAEVEADVDHELRARAEELHMSLVGP